MSSAAPLLYEFTFLGQHVKQMLERTDLVRPIQELIDFRGRERARADESPPPRQRTNSELLDFFFVKDPPECQVWWPIEIEVEIGGAVGPSGVRCELTCLLKECVGKGQPFVVDVRGEAGSGKTLAGVMGFRDCVVADRLTGSPRLNGCVPLWVDLPSKYPAPGSAHEKEKTGWNLFKDLVDRFGCWPPVVLSFFDFPPQAGRWGPRERVVSDWPEYFARFPKVAKAVPHGVILLSRGPVPDANTVQKLKDVVGDHYCSCKLLRPSDEHKQKYAGNYLNFRRSLINISQPADPIKLPDPARKVVEKTPELLHFSATLSDETQPQDLSSLPEILNQVACQRIARDVDGDETHQGHALILYTRVALEMIYHSEVTFEKKHLEELFLRPQGFVAFDRPTNLRTFQGSLYYVAPAGPRQHVFVYRGLAEQLAESLLVSDGDNSMGFFDDGFRDFFAGVYALYWYKGPGVRTAPPRAEQDHCRDKQWAQDVVTWMFASPDPSTPEASHPDAPEPNPEAWLGATERLAAKLHLAQLALLLEEMLKQRLPDSAPLHLHCCAYFALTGLRTGTTHSPSNLFFALLIVMNPTCGLKL